jgi:hypothetical protein
MGDATAEERVEWLQNGLREIGKLCLKLGGSDGTPAPDATPTTRDIPPVQEHPEESGGTTPVPTAGVETLSQFLGNVLDLTPAERLSVVEAAIAMLDQVFVHLPLKRAMHGIEPLQRLRLMRRRLALQIKRDEAEQSARAFHDEMIEIFHSLRDLHTNYILPASYHGKTAFLPFLVEEYFEGAPPKRVYLVTKTRPGFTHPTFKPGVTVTHWNGIPIDRAVELNAAREAGSNLDARHARGLEALTLRPMALTAPPDEAWVIIGFRSGNRQLEVRFDWQVATPTPSVTGADVDDPLAMAGDAARVMGFDAATEAVRRAKKSLFFLEAMGKERNMARIMVAAQDPAARRAAADSHVLGYDVKGEALRRTKAGMRFPDMAAAQRCVADAASAASTETPAGEGPDTTSLLPDFFSFKKVPTPSGVFGYIRIYSFMAFDANAFVAEFIRITKLLPQNGLIVDVRGNGGGNIRAGEQLLQVLTPKAIEPERFHFINTPTTLALCSDEPSLAEWVESISLAVETGEIYSQGFPLTSVEMANSIKPEQRYPGKVVLVIDALCYSTTDIFTAGFQDHAIGKILGTSGHTGAGGANVWTYDFFAHLPGFNALPKGVSFRTAVRRSTRVGAQMGVPLEDLGVRPDAIHRMTRRDILEGNLDLIDDAATMF